MLLWGEKKVKKISDNITSYLCLEGSNMDFKEQYLSNHFEEIPPTEFYRNIFKKGELQEQGVYGNNRYNGIAVELADKIRRYTITDGLEVLDQLLQSENFIIISPISYIGKSRTSENARMMYALAIDLDGVNKEINMIDLFHQINKVEHLPRPTYTVISGSGLHLYYVFEKPIPLFRNVVEQLTRLKNDLTRKIWNGWVTDLNEKVQYQSIFQGFRLVGGVTKSGSRTQAFVTGDRVTVEYLNEFVFDEKNEVKEFVYKSNLTLEQAKKKYPEWYEKRIVQHKPKGTWTCKRDLYDWWLKRLYEIKEGHRYYGVMCLCIYAKKCGISREELEHDAFGLVDRLDILTTDEENHFTREDVLCALELFNDNYITFPIDTISKLTEIRIKKNKRNYRKQSLHLRMARSNLEILNEDNGKPLQGRKAKKDMVEEWQKDNPNGRKCDCIRDTGLSKPTVYKWWN